jgi:CheY-like chemotaxis protein
MGKNSRAEGRAQPHRSKRRLSDDRRFRTVPLKNQRVAIFNDGADILTTLQRWMQMNGHRAWTAQLSEMREAHHAAMEFVIENRADVVLFDVGMPYACNWDLADVLQVMLREAGHAVPFVFTSANTDELDRIVGRTGAYELTGTVENLNGLLPRIYAACQSSHAL